MGATGFGMNTSSSSSESASQSLSEYFSNAFSSNSSTSQNTSSSQGTSTSSSKSGTSESRLSNLQGDILENRENQYNNYYFPELQNAIAEQTAGSESFNAATEQNANAINTAYDASQKATEQTLAQQGLSGTGNGVNAALTAANNRARSSSLAQAYFNQLSTAQTNKATLLNSMASLMPSTTNAATYYENSESNSQSDNTSTSQGTSESTGSSTSESGGSSESKSASSANSSSFGMNSYVKVGGL